MMPINSETAQMLRDARSGVEGRYRAVYCVDCKAAIWRRDTEESTDGVQCNPCKKGRVRKQCMACLEPTSNIFKYQKIQNESWDNMQTCFSHVNCKPCFANYVAMCIKDGVWNIKCPGKTCGYLLINADVRVAMTYYDSAEYRRYMEMDEPHEITGSMLYDQFCYNRAQDQRKGTEQVMSAALVKFEAMQFSCPSTKSTEDNETSNNSNVEEWAISKEHTAQACPQCHTITSKNGGCNQMTCRCGISFCWPCGGPYQETGEYGKKACVCRDPMIKDINKEMKFGLWLRCVKGWCKGVSAYKGIDKVKAAKRIQKWVRSGFIMRENFSSIFCKNVQNHFFVMNCFQLWKQEKLRQKFNKRMSDYTSSSSSSSSGSSSSSSSELSQFRLRRTQSVPIKSPASMAAPWSYPSSSRKRVNSVVIQEEEDGPLTSEDMKKQTIVS